MEPCSTPHPTKPQTVDPTSTPHPTMKPTKKKNSGGTYLTKAPKTPRPTTWKAPKPSKQPRTKAPKPTKGPKPTKAPKPKKSRGPKGPPGDEEMENAEMMAVDLSGSTAETLSGYSSQTEIVGLLSIATVFAICGYSIMCKQRKEDSYSVIEDPVNL